MAHVAAAVFRRVERKLTDREPAARQRRFVEGAPLLVAMADAFSRGLVATGRRRGCRIVGVPGPTSLMLRKRAFVPTPSMLPSPPGGD